MKEAKTMLIGSIVWAVVFMLSAFVFRGRSVGIWIQGVLFVVWTMCFSYWSINLPRRSCR